ncbi:MAG: Hsp20 family protein [Chitinispirillaceae bacterium]|jgi:HSP20 family molecular chaperone IbpA|nr:Hsp20 family protein [Chitinispirillaceae bacterium]
MSEEQVISLSPNVCFEADEDDKNGTLEIALPGVKKEDIELKLNEDSYSIVAKRGETKYVASQSFCCPVIPKKAKATYENGLLQIKVPFKETMEHAVAVKVE